MNTSPMRRWLIIVLLLIYPFQVSLAMADKCCATTPSGVTHHALQAGDAAEAQPVFEADDAQTSLGDPHCAACASGHGAAPPCSVDVLPAPAPAAGASPSIALSPASLPAGRPERPKWIPARL